jgi:glyoxylase-like metal-dependent hydrolase (beta-lactamase superfamily II)
LFIGSCGRPDLVGSVGFTSEQMGQLMFNTLKNKICTLPSTVKVFPAHGAGSPCGKNLSSDLYSTIGKEKETNPALQYTDEKEFIKFLTSDQPAAPSYFSYNVQQNTVR